MPEDMENSVFQQDDRLYNKKINSVPKPEVQTSVNNDTSIINNIVNEGDAHNNDINAIESFTNISRSRDQLYSMLEAMCQDSTISAVLETYAEDATETNEDGRKVWVDSDDASVQKFVDFLLKALEIDKNVYNWVYHLCEYGDVYIKLYHQSEIEDDKIFNKQDDDKQSLNEEVKIKAFRKNDKFAHYVSTVDDPAEMFELTKFGKTCGFICAPTGINNKVSYNNSIDGQSISTPYTNLYFKFRKNDVLIYGPTEFVHAALEDNSSRIPEKVDIFLDQESYDTDSNAYSYSVRRGQSILYQSYKIWRELQLLENAVILNRLTRSSIVRIVGVEVGDMPKTMVAPHLQRIKSLIEQKSALNASVSMSEYNNPGPIENTVYVPTHNGQGAISMQTIGGDVDVKSLIDLDYFKNKMFGSLRVPKQYFNETDDSTGFNGGTSLSIISSRYAKMIKRIQATMCQAITDLVNIFILDKVLDSYIGKFTIRMTPPTTQEELDRRENTSAKVGIVSDIMNLLGDLEPAPRLAITDALLSNIITEAEVKTILEEEIEKLNAQAEAEAAESEEDFGGDEDLFDNDFGGGPSGGGGDPFNLNDVISGGFEEEEPAETGGGGEEALPAMDDLGVDFADNSAAEGE